MTAPQIFPLASDMRPADAIGNALALAEEAAFDVLEEEMGEAAYDTFNEDEHVIPVIDDLGRPITAVRLERHDGKYQIILITEPAA